MSSSASRGGTGERTAHQDFIARIRFSNALPPPPNPPKLLDIPNTGLASGQYTTPGFASRLAREQPLNIEVDAELGMPLDLVGMPGIFDGDESSIQAPAQKPQVHPHDQPLLKPLATLGKPRVSETHVSFLRRTEYISSVAPKHRVDALRPMGNALRRAEKRKSPEPDAGTPAFVKRKLDKGFALAVANLKDRSRVQHPTKKKLRLTEAYPVLPDLDSFPDSGAYVTVKFITNPVPSASTYDRRLLSGLFVPIEKSEAEEKAVQAAMDAHDLDPEHNPKPANAMNYQFYLPDSAATAEAFQAKFDVDNPDRDSEDLYTAHSADQAGVFRFERVRAYETGEEREMTHETKYNDEIVLSFAAASRAAGGTPAALYLPVMQRSTIRSQRGKNIARTIGMSLPEDEEDEEVVVDCLEVKVADPPEDIVEEIAKIRADPLRWNEVAEEEEGQDEDDEAALAEQLNGRGSESRGRSPVPNGRGARGHAASDEEPDAEGEDIED